MLTEDQVDTVMSYADGAERVMEELCIDRTTLNCLLLDFNVERCPNCGWYCEAGELTGEDSEPDGFCENCRRYDAHSNGTKLTGAPHNERNESNDD